MRQFSLVAVFFIGGCIPASAQLPGVPVPINVQFTGLAATDDGRLLFATFLRPHGLTEAPGRSRIYQVSGDQLSLIATSPARGGIIPPSFSEPFISGDGTVSGYNEFVGCGTPSCGLSGLPRNVIHITGRQLPPVVLRSGHVSRNGRYLTGMKWPIGVVVADFETQEVWSPPADLTAFHNRSIANDGTALFIQSGTPDSAGRQTQKLIVWHPHRELRRPPESDYVYSGAISPDARFIAFERATETHRELVRYVVDSGELRVLSRVPLDPAIPFVAASSRFQPTFSNDGSLLYLDFDAETGLLQPALLTAAGEQRRLAAVPEGGRDSIIAGDGHLAWVLTNSGRLLRVDVAGGVFDAIIPETPSVTRMFGGAVPGSAVHVIGAGITANTEITLGSRTRSPVTEVTPKWTSFQIPWDFQQDGRTEVIFHGPGSPFEHELPYSIATAARVTFERDVAASPANPLLQMAHQDFRGLVTDEDPALPGETVHLFASNLGPVDRSLENGEPSPFEPVARITTPFACYLEERRPGGRLEGAVLPFVGLSPGAIGVYQIDVTIPRDWPAGRTVVQCRLGAFEDADTFAVGP